MNWRDVSDLLHLRALRLGLPDDELDLLFGAYSCLQKIVDKWDLPSYTVINEAMFQTRANERHYPLPEDFGRLLHVHDQRAVGVRGTGLSGLWLSTPTSTQLLPLRFKNPVMGRQEYGVTARRPDTFLLSQRMLVLDPAPDQAYTGVGVYIKQVPRPDFAMLDEDVPLDEPMVIVASALYEAASDRGLAQARDLRIEMTELMGALTRNAASLMQQFYTQLWPMRAYR